MKELVVISGKGGTGKTTVTGALATLAKDAVFADCDVDASDLHLLLSPQTIATHPFSGGKSAVINADMCTQCGVCRDICRFQAINTDFVIDSLSCEGCGVCVWNCPVNAIEFNDRMHGEWYESSVKSGTPFIHASLYPGEENSGKLVTLVKQQARAKAEEIGRELLLIDGPPGTGCPVISAIGGADLLLIVTEPTLSAIHDMKRVIALGKHFDVPVLLVINKYDLNNELCDIIIQFADKEGIKIAIKIPFHDDILKAHREGVSIIEYSDGELHPLFIELWNQINQSI